ncbi:dihydroorotase [bacterium]|nr:dihydroorotase [bacterium]MBU1071845.1 dihydroorotase [bacterium]MBU1676327.1 dihydroorotase [bacterium]
MEWNWKRIPAEYLVTNVRLCRGGKLSKRSGFLHVMKGRVEGLGVGSPAREDVPVLDGKGLVCAPGLVDVHVHFREPGQEEKETIATGARAAAAGGFTSVVTMPNTTPPVDSAPLVRYILDRANEAGSCRVFPTAAISKGQRGETLTEFGDLVGAGAVGFTDDGRPVMHGKLMQFALQYSRMLGVPVTTHAEDCNLSGNGVMHAGYWSTKLGLAGIPRLAEDTMIFRDVELAKATGGHLHVAHVSTTGAVDIIRRAKQDGARVTAEVTPHHLSLDHSRCRDFSPLFKMSPPLREEEDIEALTQGLVDGVLDCVATDHAPHTAMEKELMLDQAPFGVIGLETALAVCNTYLVEENKLDLGQLISRMSERAAEIYDLPVGRLEEGNDADFMLFAPDEAWTVHPEQLRSKSKNTPYGGATLTGRVKATFLRGRLTHHEEF